MACRAPPGLFPAHVIGSAVTHSAAHDASLSLTSRTDRGGYVIAALRGELGIASAPALREQLLSLLRAASQLIIDLSAVEHARTPAAWRSWWVADAAPGCSADPCAWPHHHPR